MQPSRRLFADAIVCRTAMHQHVEMEVRFMLRISAWAQDRSEIATGDHSQSANQGNERFDRRRRQERSLHSWP